MDRIAGSAAEVEQVILRNGSSVVIQPLAPGDEGAIDEWFARLSAETRYARFLGPVKELDRRTRSDLARVDHRDHEAIAAVAPDGATVGIARYIRVGGTVRAEVAVAVADEWRGLGIAGRLLHRVRGRARETGIERFTALCLASNETVIRLLSRLGPTTTGLPDFGVVELQIDLTREV